MNEDFEIRAKALECAILLHGSINKDRDHINNNLETFHVLKDFAEKMEKYIRNNTF